MMRRIVLSMGLWAGLWGSVAAQQVPEGSPAPTTTEKPLTRRQQRALEKEQQELEKKLTEARAKRAALRAQMSSLMTERERERSEALFVDGVKYSLLEDYNKALESLLKAYAIDPDNAAINYKIAEANMLSGNMRDAANYAESATRIEPKNAYYYLLLAQIQASQKQYDWAI